LISLNHNILLDCSLNTSQSHEIHSKNLHFIWQNSVQNVQMKKNTVFILSLILNTKRRKLCHDTKQIPRQHCNTM